MQKIIDFLINILQLNLQKLFLDHFIGKSFLKSNYIQQSRLPLNSPMLMNILINFNGSFYVN